MPYKDKNMTKTSNGFGVKNFNNTIIDWCIFPYTGVPDATVGVNFAGKGAICIDVTNANVYINSGTKIAPVWKLVTRAA